MPYGDLTAEIELDFIDHRLAVRTSDGATAGFPLHDRLACARFYDDLFARSREVGVAAEIHATPFDLGDSPPFALDTEHDSYDAEAVGRWWAVLRSTDAALAALPLALRRQGQPDASLLALARHRPRALQRARRAADPGADPVTAEAYSHEVIAFGWWPGDDRRTPFPAFYSYTSPEPETLREQPLQPAAAAWQDAGGGSLAVLPYEDVRATPDPAATLLDFFESAYRAGSETAGWDVAALRRG